MSHSFVAVLFVLKRIVYFEKELNQNIPKEVMLQFRDEVTEAAHRVDPDFQVYLVGSFRREEKEFHDVDFIGE